MFGESEISFVVATKKRASFTRRIKKQEKTDGEVRKRRVFIAI